MTVAQIVRTLSWPQPARLNRYAAGQRIWDACEARTWRQIGVGIAFAVLALGLVLTVALTRAPSAAQPGRDVGHTEITGPAVMGSGMVF